MVQTLLVIPKSMLFVTVLFVGYQKGESPRQSQSVKDLFRPRTNVFFVLIHSTEQYGVAFLPTFPTFPYQYISESNALFLKQLSLSGKNNCCSNHDAHCTYEGREMVMVRGSSRYIPNFHQLGCLLPTIHRHYTPYCCSSTL